MSNVVDDFNSYRKKMNDRILETENLGIKRFFNLDTAVYQDGALDRKTKEMMGLAASMVLRCDDCIRYHAQECHRAGVTREQFEEIFSVSVIVGGSIVIPHLRRAVEFIDALVEG